jgi:hypothetical protein
MHACMTLRMEKYGCSEVSLRMAEMEPKWQSEQLILL